MSSQFDTSTHREKKKQHVDIVVCRVGEHQHRLAHRCSCENFSHVHMKCEVRHNWDMAMGHLWLNGLDIYDLMGGAFTA